MSPGGRGPGGGGGTPGGGGGGRPGGGGGGGGGSDVPSLSRIVSTAVLVVPRVAPPVGALSVRFTVSLFSTAASSTIGTVKLFGVVSPAAQVSVPLRAA